jgi:hypothetical protein
MRDENGTVISAKNVIVLSVQSRVLDGIGRLTIPLLEPSIQRLSREGSADMMNGAVVYRNGKSVVGWWNRGEADSVSGGWRFDLQQNFKPIPLAPGTTWVEVIDWDGI